MAFTIGMKVVCVDDSPISGDGTRGHWMIDRPIKNEIYTIIGILPGAWGDYQSFRLKEISNDPIGFRSTRFRPLVSRKTETSFTVGADPESEKWDNRKPLPVYSFDVAGHEDIMQYLREFY